MKMYVVRYNDTEKGTTVRSESFSKEEQTAKINECAQKGFEVIDTFEGPYEKVINMKSSKDA